MVDPRHPLCGRTLPLVGITQKSYLGRCCVVWIRPHVERNVPVSATDLEFNPNELSPVPLSLASIQQLVRVFDQVTRAREGGEVDGTCTNTPDRIIAAEPGGEDSTLSGMALPDRGSTTPCPTDRCAHLPGTDHDTSPSTGKRGAP